MHAPAKGMDYYLVCEAAGDGSYAILGAAIIHADVSGQRALHKSDVKAVRKRHCPPANAQFKRWQRFYRDLAEFKAAMLADRLPVVPYQH